MKAKFDMIEFSFFDALIHLVENEYCFIIRNLIQLQ